MLCTAADTFSWDYAYDNDGLLTRRSQLDGTIAINVLRSVQQQVFYYQRNHVLAGHTGSCKMYKNTRWSYYWPLMESFIQTYVEKGTLCARTRGADYRQDDLLVRFQPHNLIFVSPWTF